MELAINNTQFQTWTTCDQNFGSQLGPTDEPRTSGQSGLIRDQSSSGGPTAEPFTSDQSEQTGDQGMGGSSGPTADHCTSIQSDQIGDQSSSGQPVKQALTSNQSGPAGDQISSIQSGTVLSPHSGTGSLGLLSMQYRGNSSDDNCSDR